MKIEESLEKRFMRAQVDEARRLLVIARSSQDEARVREAFIYYLKAARLFLEVIERWERVSAKVTQVALFFVLISLGRA